MRSFEELKGLAKHHKQAFGRIVKCEMYKVDAGKILALTRMHDDYHDMNLAVLLDDGYRIEEIAARMDRIPYPCCERGPLALLPSLAGIGVLERGGLRKVKERIPRNQGCTHIYEMIEATFRAIFVGSYSIVGRKWEDVLDLTMEENRQLGIRSPILSDTCYAFNPASADPALLRSAHRKIEEAKRKMEAIEAVKEGKTGGGDPSGDRGATR